MLRKRQGKSLYSLIILVFFSSFLHGQSLIPSVTDGWLSITNTNGNGCRDTIATVFFEVPDTMTSPIYFGICDPDGNDTVPDVANGGGTSSTIFTLYGGDDAYTGSGARDIFYGYPTPSGYDDGTSLQEYIYDEDGTNPPTGPVLGGYGDEDWVYFDAVYPSEGEHVGNYYFFRIVVHADEAWGDDFKNSFRLIASYTGTNLSDPAEISSIRAFSYSWPVNFQDDTTRTWNFYPFVPDTAVSTDELNIFINDIDNEGPYSLYDIEGTLIDSITPDNGTGSYWESDLATDGNTDYVFGTQINGTWNIQYPETAAGTFDGQNIAELWAEDTGTGNNLRIYSEFYKPAEADHVVASHDSSETGTFRTVYLQLVDSSGAAVPYARSIYLINPSTTLRFYEDDETTALAAIGADALVTTNSDGFYVFTCTDTADETVTLSFLTDGTNSSDRLPASGALGTNDTVQVTFDSGNIPTLVSSGTDLTALTEGNAVSGINFTVTDVDGGYITSGNDIYIQIPDSVEAVFETSVTTPTITGTASGSVNGTVSYPDNKTLCVDVTTNLAAGETVILSGLEFTNATLASSGDFELSYSGASGPWNVVDTLSAGYDIVIDGSAYEIWIGGSGTGFTTNANWSDGTYPVTGTGAKIILANGTTEPTLDLSGSDYDCAEMIISSGTTLTITGTNDLVVNSNWENSGDIIITGTNVDFSGNGITDNPSLGNVTFNGSGAINYSFYDDFTISSGTWTYAETENITVYGDVTLGNGVTITMTVIPRQFYVYGGWTSTNDNGVIENGIGDDFGLVYLVGTDTVTISGDMTFRYLVCAVPGKQIIIETGSIQTVTDTLTLTGSSTGDILLRSTATDWTIDNQASTIDVSYVDVEYGNTDTADISCDYSTLTNCNNLVTGFNWTTTTAVVTTWDGSTDGDVTDDTNWDNGAPVISRGDTIIFNGAGSTPTLTAAWDMTGNTVTIESGGVLDIAGYALTCDSFQNDGTLQAQSAGTVSTGINTDSGTVEFSGGGAALGLGNTYNDIDFAGGAWTLGAGLVVNGDLFVSTGSLDSNTYTIAVAGDIDLTGSLALDTDITVNGDFTSSGGILTQSAGTATFAGGSHTVTGGHTWFNFACSTDGAEIYFADTVTQTINGDFTIQGSAGNLITLDSSTTTAWLIDVTAGTVDVDYADLSYSDASSSTTGPHVALNSQSSRGNNSGWGVFSGATATYTWEGDDGTNPTLWNVDENWDTGIAPANSGLEQIIIPDVANDPVINENVAIDTLTIEANGVLDTDGFDLVLSTPASFSNAGTLILTGDEGTLTLTMDTGSGLVQYKDGTGAGSIIFTAFNDLEIAGTAQTHSLSGNTAVGGALTVTSGTLGGTNQTLTVTGDTVLDSSVTFTGAAVLNLNGGVSSLTGAVSVVGGTINITAAADITLTGSLDAGTGSVIIGMGANDLFDIAGGDTTADITANTITVTSTGTNIGNITPDFPIDTASPGTCTLTLPSGSTTLAVTHTGSVDVVFGGGDRIPAVDSPLYLTATDDLTLPGNTIETGTTAMTLTAGTDGTGTLTVPAACSLAVSSGAMALTAPTLTIPAGAGTISSTSTGSLTLTQSTGDFTLLRALSGDTGTVSISADAGAIALQAAVSLTAGSGTTNLVAYGTITQTAAGIVTSDVLNAETHVDAGADITLDQANFSENVSLQSLDATVGTTVVGGNITYVDDGGFDVVLIETTGYADLTCTTGTPNNAFGDITQSGTITAGELAVSGTGDISLDDTGNSIDVLSASTTGWLLFAENQNVEIGTANGMTGLTATNIRLVLDGDAAYSVGVTQTQPISCTGLILEGAYGNFTLDDPTSANSITDLALYGSAAGTPLRARVEQTGDLTLGEIVLDTTTFSGVTRTGAVNVENLTLVSSGDYIIDNGTVASWEVTGDFSLTADELLDNGVQLTTAGNVTLNLANAAPTAQTNLWIFDGTTLFTISGSSVALNDIQLGTATAGGSLSFNGALTQDINGALSVLDGAATTLDITNDTLTVGGDIDLTNLDTFTVTGSTVTMDGTADQTLATGGISFNDLVISNTAGTGTEVTATDDTTTAGILTVSAGVFDSGDGAGDTLTVGTVLTLSGTGGLAGLSAVDINGSAILGGTGAFDAGDRAISCAGDWTESAAVFDSSGGTSTVTIDGASTITSNGASSFDNLTLSAAADLASAITCNDDLTIGAAGSLDVTATNYAIAVGGNWDNGNGGTFTGQSGAVTLTGAAMTIDGMGNAGATNSFYNLDISGGDRTSTTDDIVVRNNLSLSGGTLDMDGADLTVTGVFSNDQTLFLTGVAPQAVSFGTDDTDSGVIQFDGAGTTLAGLTDFYDLVLTGGGARVISADINVYHDLDASGVTAACTNSAVINFMDDAGSTGTYTPPGTSANFTFYDLYVETGNALSVGGAGSTLTIERNWNMGGTLTPGDDTVEFVTAGTASTLTGDTTFYNLTCTAAGKTLTFTDGSAQTISAGGVLTITGTDVANLVHLEGSGAAGWTLNHLGTESVDWATVEYGQVTGTDISATNSVDVDLTCDTVSPGWIFAPKTVTWDGSASTDWFDGANWDWGYEPNDTDNVIIADTAGGNQPALTGDVITNNLQINNDSSQGSMTVGNNTLTVNGTFNNDGELIRQGYVLSVSSVNVTDTDTGLTTYSGGGVIQDYGAGDDYNNLEISGVALTTGAALQVAGDLTITGGSLDTSGYALSVTGATVGTTGAVGGTGTLQTTGTEVLDIAGDIAINRITVPDTSNSTIQAASDFTPVILDNDGAGGTVANGTVVLDDANASNLGGHSFYNLTFGKSAAGVTVTSIGGLSVTGTLTMTTGTWDAATFSHTVAGNWNSSGANFNFTANTSTIELTGGSMAMTTLEGFNNLSITGAVTQNSLLEVGGDLTIGGTGSFAAAGTNTVTVDGTATNSGAITSTGTGNFTFNGDYAGTAGSLAGSTGGNPQWTFNGDASFGTVDMDGDPVYFNAGTASHTLTVAANPSTFSDVYVDNGDDVTLAGAGLFVVDTSYTLYTVGTTDVFDAASASFDIDTLDNEGRFRLVGDQATQTVGTYDIDSGWTEYYSGVTVTLSEATMTEFWNLEISSGTYTLGQGITIYGNEATNYDDNGLFITGGTLNGGANTITLEECFSVTGGTFGYDTSEVIFTGSGDGYIQGSITFYDLTCSYLAHDYSPPSKPADTSVSSKDIYFDPDSDTTIAAGGHLTLSGNPATGPANDPLTAAYEGATTYLTLRPTTDPADTSNPTATEYWRLDMTSGSYIFMENICAWYSDASSNPFILQTNVYTWQCPGWESYVYVTQTDTDDSDSNGKIDRLLVTVVVDVLQAGESAYDDFDVSVTGYTVTGFSDGPDRQHFYIDLQEKSYLDTDVTPTWQINTNSTFVDFATGTKYVAIAATTDTAIDSAPPVIGYTLAVPGRSDMFVHFSEPVQDGGALDPDQGDFSFTGLTASANGFTTVTAGGSGGVEEALILFDAALTTAEITGGTIDGSALQDVAATPNTMAALSRNNGHAISDLLIGPTNNGPMEPLWARDETSASSSGSGTGVINEFDGSEHLKDEDITLQAHLNDDYNSAAWADGDIKLRFIQNPGSTYVNGNSLWLDDLIFAEDDVSGLAPYLIGSGSVNSVDGSIADGPTNHVWNFILDDSDISNSADLSFLFYLTNEGATPYAGRYAARIDDDTAANWYRRVYPWSFGVHNIVDQGAGVSILNNVINPLKGEQTTLYYNLTKGGMVSVQIFDLAGGLVEILHRGRQDAGEYSLSWNGTNRSNNPVARGIYFVRLVGPGVDEMRKVLVVK